MKPTTLINALKNLSECNRLDQVVLAAPLIQLGRMHDQMELKSPPVDIYQGKDEEGQPDVLTEEVVCSAYGAFPPKTYTEFTSQDVRDLVSYIEELEGKSL